MLKKMSGKKLTNDQMEKLKIRGGQIIVITPKPGCPIEVDIEPYDACKDYCDDRCGFKKGSDKAHSNGQDYYQG